jgi:hypothetical protein
MTRVVPSEAAQLHRIRRDWVRGQNPDPHQEAANRLAQTISTAGKDLAPENLEVPAKRLRGISTPLLVEAAHHASQEGD